jgi:hypothetical protein
VTRAELVAFLRRYKLAVQTSVAPSGAPQAAVVGFAVSDALEIAFDAVMASRKHRNLTHVRARPAWVRYGDFTRDPPPIQELDMEPGRESAPWGF